MPAPTSIAEDYRRLGRQILRAQRSLARRFKIPTTGLCMKAGIFLSLSAIAAGAAALALVAGPSLRGMNAKLAMASIRVPTPDLSEEIRSVMQIGDYTPAHLVASSAETLLSLFARFGISDEQAFKYISSTPDLKTLLFPQAGQHFSAGVAPDGRLVYLRQYLEGPHARDSRTIEVSRIGEALASAVLPYAFDTREELVSGVVEKTLWDTAQTLKIPANVLEALQSVWDGSDNPVKNLRPGDSIRLVYEKKYADGRFVRDGQLLAVQIVEDGRRVTTPNVYEAFWFQDGIQTGSYYTLDGRSASQTFMRIPLDVKDISSEFSPLRRHPITGVVRSHNGTDMRAPSGSRIFAAADGTISLVAFDRNGFGNYVKIDHGLGRVTLYAHMRSIAKGIKNGVRVKKGQVIGYVGMTGLATGPHLHYELMIDGVQINPKTADLPDTENLSAFQTAQLRQQSDSIRRRFELAAEIEGKPSPERILAAQLEREAAEAQGVKNENAKLAAQQNAALKDETSAAKPAQASEAGSQKKSVRLKPIANDAAGPPSTG